MAGRSDGGFGDDARDVDQPVAAGADSEQPRLAEGDASPQLEPPVSEGTDTDANAEIERRMLVAKVGWNLLRLATDLTKPHFVQRRVESLHLVDTRTAKRRVEVHLRLNELDNTEYPRVDRLLFVPIARLEMKHDSATGDHTMLDMRDEHNARMPRLTLEEERDFVVAGIWWAARESLGHDPDDEAVKTLSEIVRGRCVVEELDQEAYDVVGMRKVSDGELLYGDQTFQTILRDAAKFFHVIAPLDRARGVRRVVSFEYLENPKFSSVDLLRRLASPQPGVAVGSDTPGAADCSSYHFEFYAPQDVRIGVNQLEIKRADEPVRVIPGDSRHDGVAHVHWSGTGPLSSARFVTQIIPTANGTTWAMRGVLLITAMLQFLGFLFARYANDATLRTLDRSALAAVLLIAPGVVTAMLATRTRHPLTSRMLYGPRLNIIVPTLVLYLSSITMVPHAPRWGLLECVWGLGLLVTAGCVFRMLREWAWMRAVR